MYSLWKTAFAAAVLPVALALVLSGCGGSTPVSGPPADEKPAASEARVLLNGQAATGVLPVPSSAAGAQGAPAYASMKLACRFTPGAGGSPVAAAYCDYDHEPMSGMGGGMMGHHRRFALYDDGTHGDDVPHDGVYCRQDDVDSMMGSMGMPMHDRNEMAGRHAASFFCLDGQGRESNHERVEFRMTKR